MAMLIVLIIGAVNLPFVHTLLTEKANSVLEKKGIPIHAGKITLLLNGKIGISELSVILPPNDTIIYGGNLSVDIRPLPLLSKKVIIKSVNFSDVVANILTDTVTGNLRVTEIFNSSGQTTDETTTTDDSKPWDISVKTIRFKNIRFVYSDPKGGIFVKQNLEKVKIEFDFFSLIKQQIDVKDAILKKPEGMVSIWKKSDVEEEETDIETNWKFSLENLEISDLDFTLDQPVAAQQMNISLERGRISLKKLDLTNLEMDIKDLEFIKPQITLANAEIAETKVPEEPKETAISFSLPTLPWSIKAEKVSIHDGSFNQQITGKPQNQTTLEWLPLQNLNASFRDISITPGGYQLNLDKLNFRMVNGVELESGTMHFKSDAEQNLELKLSLSTALKENKRLKDKQAKLRFETFISGNDQKLQISQFILQSPNGLKINLTGQITEISTPGKAGIDLQFGTGLISRNQILPVVSVFSPETVLPRFQPVIVTGSIKNKLLNPVFTLRASSKSGKIMANGNFNVKQTSGNLKTSFTDILLSDLMGGEYPKNISGSIEISGQMGAGLLPEGEAVIMIDSVSFKNKTTRNILLKVVAEKNQADISVFAADSALNIDLNGHFAMNSKNSYSGKINGLLNFDLFAMNFTTYPIAASSGIDAELNISGNQIAASAELSDLIILNKKDTFQAGDLEFQLDAGDTIKSAFNSRFLNAMFYSEASFSDFKDAFASARFENLFSLDSANFENTGAFLSLKKYRFDATIHPDPVFGLFLSDTLLNFSDISIEIGQNMDNSIAYGTIKSDWFSFGNIKSIHPSVSAKIDADKLTFDFSTDSLLSGQVKFGEIGVSAEIMPTLFSGNFFVFKKSDTLLHHIDFEVLKEKERVVVQSGSPEWLIDQSAWILSPREFLTWDKTSETLYANLDLHFNESYIGFKGKNTDTLELDIRNFGLNLLKIPGIDKFIPDGSVDLGVIYTHTDEHHADINVQVHQMKWENFGLDLMSVNGELTVDTTGNFNGDFQLTADDSLSIQVEMASNNAENEFELRSSFSKLSFLLFEPFISDFVNNLHGTSDGTVLINSKNDKLTLNGEIGFNNFGLKVIPLETSLAIADSRIRIIENQFIFNDFTVFDSLKRPLKVNGNIIFENTENIWADLMVETDKINLMNITEKDNAAFFGSVFINSALNIKGSVFSPSIKGKIELEEGTNLTYQLIQDLSVPGSQTDVVFATITDSLTVLYPDSLQLNTTSAMPDIETTIGINPKSIFNVKVSDIFGIDITVGGDGLLNYNILPNNTMSLNGVYEIKTGECKLKITGWPLKNFAITPGSMLQWDGSIENPVLNLQASTRVKGSYFNPIDNKSRAVEFTVSMQMTNKLSELQIQFSIQSPDQYITSIINSFSDDEKMRQAINLLIFETIDIPGIERSGDYISSQINSFWESQLNSLSRSTLKNTNLSFGIDSYNQTTESGNQERTSFTYEMEHRFLNNRATVRLSGKLNDYSEDVYQTNSIFENFIFEYALDPDNTKNLKLYQKRDYEDMLEGEVIKYGAGFLYRKNYPRLKDIWQRDKKQKQHKPLNKSKQR